MARAASSDRSPERSSAPLGALTFTGGGLDRRAEERDRADLVTGLLADPRTRVLAVRAGSLPVVETMTSPDDDPARSGQSRLDLHLRPPEPGDADRLAFFLGRAGEGALGPGGERPAYLGVVEVAPDAPVDGPAGEADDGAVSWRALRSIAVRLSAPDATLAATVSALANWHATHPHCPRCGHPTDPVHGGWVRRCPADRTEHFPRTDPAVIVAVTDDDDRLLLARGTGFTAAGMSVLAGFVEPGESLEEAVAREVAEEVGVLVADVEFLGDQPWPFPTGLMVGFRARARTTELALQDGEIESAQWFTREAFAAALADGSLQISGRLSIARRLIEHWWGGPLEVPERTLRQ